MPAWTMNEERPENGSKWIFSSLFTKGLERSRSLEKISYSGQDTNKKCVDNQIIYDERSHCSWRGSGKGAPPHHPDHFPIDGSEGDAMRDERSHQADQIVEPKHPCARSGRSLGVAAQRPTGAWNGDSAARR